MSQKIRAAITAVAAMYPKTNLPMPTWKKWWTPMMNGYVPGPALSKEEF